MPRPRKCRRVCSKPKCIGFSPQEGSENTLTMTIDEYESIRLIDFQGLTQEQCAEQMQVARTTIQAIYARARKTLAQCIVEGCHLHINGGDVLYCEYHKNAYGSNSSCKKRHSCKYRKDVAQ